MTREELLRSVRDVVEDHIRAINEADDRSMRSQLVGGHRDEPFQAYFGAMQLLRPLVILSMELDEPERRVSPPYPRTCVYVTLQLESGPQRETVELPVWVLEESGKALIASRIRMRKARPAASGGSA